MGLEELLVGFANVLNLLQAVCVDFQRYAMLLHLDENLAGAYIAGRVLLRFLDGSFGIPQSAG